MVAFIISAAFQKVMEWALKMCTWPTVCHNQSFRGERFFFLVLLD